MFFLNAMVIDVQTYTEATTDVARLIMCDQWRIRDDNTGQIYKQIAIVVWTIFFIIDFYERYNKWLKKK
jgi:hypothetical protein